MSKLSYKIYNEAGALLLKNELADGLKLQNIKQTLNKGVYLMNAKLNSGQNQSFKFIVQ